MFIEHAFQHLKIGGNDFIQISMKWEVLDPS